MLYVSVVAHIPASFSLQLCSPSDNQYSDDVAMGGNFSIGAVDRSQFTGDLYSAAIVKESYYQIAITDIRVSVKYL